MVSLTLPDNRYRKLGWATLAFVGLNLALFPFTVLDEGLVRLAMLSLLFAGYATAWNIFSGYSGYISFGHAVFFGLGAFMTAHLFAAHEIPPWIGMLAGGVAAVAIAALIGAITFRAGLSGIYFALAMLSVPLIFAPVLVWQGFIEISIPFRIEEKYLYMSFRGLTEYYYITLGLLVLTMLVTWWVQRNRLGYYLKAINSSEEAAESLGVNTTKYKIYALSLSGFLSALFGGMYAMTNFIYATESVFTLAISAQPVILAVAGGLGTLFGPLVAGLTLYPFAEYLRSSLGSTIPGIHNIIYGIFLMFIIIYLPDGIYPGLRQALLDEDADDADRSDTGAADPLDQPADASTTDNDD